MEDLLAHSSIPDANLKTTANILRRMAVHSVLPYWALEPLFLATDEAKHEKVVRILYYLTGMMLSSGSGGTPVPLKPSAGGVFQPLAVESLELSIISHAWIGLQGDVKSQVCLSIVHDSAQYRRYRYSYF